MQKQLEPCFVWAVYLPDNADCTEHIEVGSLLEILRLVTKENVITVTCKESTKSNINCPIARVDNMTPSVIIDKFLVGKYEAHVWLLA
jgi:hypothetical protein